MIGEDALYQLASARHGKVMGLIPGLGKSDT